MQKEIIIFDIPELSLKFNSKMQINKARNYRGLHFHSALEFVKVNSGEVGVTVGRETINLKEGEIIVINGGIIHKIFGIAENSEIILMQVKSESSADTTDKVNMCIRSFMRKKAVPSYIIMDKNGKEQELICLIKRELSEKNPAYMMFVKAHIAELFAIISRKQGGDDIGDRDLLKLMPALNYISANYSTKISLTEISKTVFTDKYNFCKNFKKLTGGTFTDYVNFVRLTAAAEMLSKGALGITEIALSCGFSSVQYFGRVFAAQFGCSPATYRRIQKKD